ncbi:MAG: hypothetical protein NC816_01395 [Candidatus Omnitrophica bacterium]|nr:hypothetical protein [Candidatus Omnitrophota bacterium]
MNRHINLLKFIISIFLIIITCNSLSNNKEPIRKRDPFIPLISEKFQNIEEMLNSIITFQGIIKTKKNKYAIINGKLYREGEEIFDNEIKVLKINDDSVEILFKFVRYKLKKGKISF